MVKVVTRKHSTRSPRS